MSEATIVVREMTLTDTAAVADLTTQLGYPAGESDIRRRYAGIHDRRDGCVFVAESGQGVVLGWIHVQTSYLLENDVRAEIAGLVVTEQARGTGIGRRLVEAAEAWARQHNLDTMAVRSNQIRTAAHAFYKRLGYTVVKTQLAFRKQLG